MVNSGLLYLKSATETRHEAQRTKDLRDAQRVLTEAITTKGQDRNPAAWYYLARYYGFTADLTGADSAFNRAQALAPVCQDDIATWRKTLWTPVFNQGVQAFNSGKTDSAMHYFRQAAAIHKEPTGLAAVAGLFANAGQPDSALRYYTLAAEAAAGDSAFAKERREALYNRGAVLYQNQRWAEAREAFRLYLTHYADDVQAMAALASAFAMSNQGDSAVGIYRQILERADSADPAMLFTAGAAMFNSVPQPPDTGARGAECRKGARTAADRKRCQDENRAALQRHDSASAGTYRMAARAFEAGLARSPFSRDGLYNLTSAYYLMQDSAKMLSVAKRMIAVDPMSRNALRLAAAAFQLRKMTDSTVYYIAVAESSLVADVNVQTFRTEEQSASLHAIVTNFHDKPSRPLKLTFEFLKPDGSVVVTQTADVPALPAGQSHDVRLEAAGQGIQAWRYKGG
jgi:tetratricopeptide (TPR) repeat protein